MSLRNLSKKKNKKNINIITHFDGDYIIKFGKYKDSKIKDCNKGYLKWLCSLPDFNNQQIINYVNTLSDDDDLYIFKFGKYIGKDLEFVYNNDKVYLYYIIHQEWFKDKDIVKSFLNEKKEKKKKK